MFMLIELPYAPDALEPVISARTLSFHYGKHLRAYVDNLNKLLPGSGLEGLPLEEIVVKAAGAIADTAAGIPNARAIFNNAGQVLNHEMYFTQFRAPAATSSDSPVTTSASPVIPSATPAIPSDPSVIPSGAKESMLLAQIEKQWGTLEALKAEFEAKGVGLFGSGWVWLQADASGELSIGQYANADNPVAHGLRPILTFDVWEHAYYLDWQNRRAAHLAALWQIVDWSVVESRY